MRLDEGILFLVFVVLSGCAHQAPRPQRVAVMPVDTLGLADQEGRALHRALQREAQRHPTARPAPTERVVSLAAATDAACRESDRCLADIGRQVPADLVLSVTLAGLGQMRLVRARLVRARDAMVLQDLQQTIGGGAAALAGSAADLTRRLFPHARGRPWYRRWWVWAALAGVVGTAVGVTWWATSHDGEPDRDPNLVHLGDL